MLQHKPSQTFKSD